MKALKFALASLLLSAPAWAVDHNARINEISLGPQQFIEIDDAMNFTFPNTPYKIVVTDANNNAVGEVIIQAIANQPNGGGDRYFVAGGPGYTGPADSPAATFAFDLPANGMACFTKGPGTNIHCVAWGNVPNVGTANPARIDAPTSGLSAQRQANNAFLVGAPSANAANPAIGASLDGGVANDGAVGGDARPPVTPMDSGDDGCSCAIGGSNEQVSRVLGALALLAVGFWLLRRGR
jgi:hypothetical protein